MKNKLLSVLIFLGSYTAYSQVGIGTPLPNSSSQLEVVATDKGVLIPRINLTGSTDAVTIKNGNINSLLVFNTATVSDVKPGYYYWYNNKWNRIVISSETNSIPGTVTYNPTTNVFSYVDNSGVSQVIDIGAIIKSKETVTTLIGNPDGSYTYTNEAGTAVKIDIVGDVTTNFSTIVNNPSVTTIIEQIVDKTKGVVIFNSTTNQFSYIDNAGNPQLVDISTIVKANETVTTLVNNGGGSYTYNNESGVGVNIDVVGDVTTNFTTIANDPAVTNIIQTIVNKTVGNVTFDSTTNQFSYVDNSGNTQLVDISTIVKANETVTTLVNNGGGSYTYNNESGVGVNIDVVGDVTTNFTTIANDPAVTNIIQTIVNKTVGNVTFDSTTNQFSYVDNSGNTQLVDISTIVKANETVTTLAQNTTTGAITYNNETGIATIVQVKSADAGNILQVGTDGGSLLTPAAITGATTVSNASAVNTSTVTVNGVTSTGAPIVNSNATSLSGSSLTTTVNGVASTPLDLSPAIAAGQVITNLAQDPASGLITYTNENAVDQKAVVTSTDAGNILQVGTDGGSLLTPAAITGATTVSNTSAVNTSTVTVNGVTSTGAPIVNSNATSLSGSSLTTTVNGVASTPLDLSPAIAAGQVITNLAQDPASGLITYTNENAVDQKAVVTSTDAGNILGVGTDGGSLLTPAAITGATTVSNTSAVNTSTVTVNGVTSTGAPIVNSNATSLSGSSLTTTVNGVASTPLDLSPAIAAGQVITNLAQDPASGLITYTNENAVDQTAVVTSTDAGNILGVGTDGGSLLTPAAITSATTVTNASAVNTSTVTVNGVTSTGAPIVNSNEATLSGSSLTTTVNGVASTPLDLSPAIAAGQVITNLTQDPTSGMITYTNENAVDQKAVVTSTDAGNILQVGTDGGSLLTPAAITGATTVSNTSAVNTSTVTVNGVTSTGAPIVNSNATSLTGSSLTTTVNGVASTPLDLGPAIISATTVSNASAVNTSTVTVNGVTSTGAPIVNSNATSLTGSSLTTTVNGVDSTPLDLGPAITSATTVSNTSAVNTSTVTVNGVTSLGAPIVNSNEATLSGSSLTTTVNGVDSTPLDLSPAITAAQTVTNLVQNSANGLITYTNENAVDQTAVVTSTDAGNILGVGTDGGTLLTSSAITGATTVSNASLVNTSTVTVNGVTSTGAPIVNSNETTLSGSSLTTTVNGVASTPLDLAPAIATATTVSNASLVNTSTVTVNGVTSTGAPIVNSNAATLSGSSLTTTVNGVASTPLDLSPAIATAQTVTNLAQNSANGLITYTNENAVDQTAVVTSTDAGNILGVGTDGGTLLTSSAITGATTVSNASLVNTSTVTVNGVTSTGAPIVNSNATSISGSSLTTTVNGVASTPLDLSPAIATAQTVTNLAQNSANGLITYTNENAVDQTAVVTSTDAGNILGVGTDGGTLLTSSAITGATTVSNASLVNTSTVTVNGVTSTGAPIVNSNATSISGSSLTTTVNGVASTPLDLSPAIATAQTVTNLAQNSASGVITYTNENAVDQTAVVTSTDAGNILGVGTDGGSLLTSSAITGATTVSNASLVNTSTVTVNGVTSTGAPIVNSNETTLSGSSLTTTVNGVDSTPLDLSPAIATAQTVTNLAQNSANGLITYTNENAVDQTAVVTSTDAGNILGVGTDGGSLLTSSAITGATTVSNTSLDNSLVTTVNGVTGSPVDIVNSNATSLSGSSLTTTVNGVASMPLDLAPAIATAQTVTNLAQDSASGLITYTNENAVDQTAVVTSTDAGNILGVGTDGGTLLTSSAITGATTVSNTSLDNSLVTTVNGVTGGPVDIVNSNNTSLSGSSLTTTVNGVDSTPLDLSPAITAAQTVTNLAQNSASGLITYTNENAVDQTAVVTSTDAGNILGIGTDGGTLLTSSAITGATTISNASLVNTSTVTVNGVTSTGAPIVNSNETTLSGSSLTTTVNGVASTPLDLAPAIATATTVSNASLVNTSTVTVNGVTSLGAPIVNSNEATLSGSSLTTTVNGVVSTPLDLSPAIATAQTVTNLAQNSANGLITYTNENAVDQTAVVTSTDAGNILGVGTDGGTLLTSSAITGATTVSNTSLDNSLVTMVNGVTGGPVDIVNSNNTSLSGSSLTTTVNGVASTPLDLTPAISAATTNTLTATDGNLISTVNGVATNPAVPVLITADNGLTATNGNVQLGGELLNPTTIITDPSFGKTLAIQGLLNGNPFNDVLIIDPATGELQKISPKELNLFDWSIEGNRGIQAPFNFLGTVDDADLIFKRNSLIAGRLEPNNTSFGVNALTDSSGGINNVAIGTSALSSNTTGQRNSALGFSAMTSNTTGSENIGAGYFALNLNTVGGQNTAYGNSSFETLGQGNRNTAVGYSSGANLASGEDITLIGAFTGSGDGLTNATAIGSGAFVATSNSLVLGGPNTNVGIGINSPTNTLHIIPATGIDPLRVEGLQTGTATDNLVVADATGVFRTVTPSRDWSLTGNAGTSSPNNFIGTLDDRSLLFKINNEQAALLSGTTYGANTSFGYLGLLNNNAVGGGIYNTALGRGTLTANTLGASNTALGKNALTNNLTGNNNIVLGADAGTNLTAGSNNIIIGSNTTTGVNASGPTVNNELNIGNTLYGTNVNNTGGANNGKIGVNTNGPTESADFNGTTRVRKLPLNGTASAIYTKTDGSSSAAADQTFTAVNTVVVDANGVLGTIPGIALTTPPSVQTIQYSRTTTAINAATPVNSVTSIGLLSIRFNGSATTSGNYIEFRTDVSNQVTAFAEVSGSGGNYFANWRTTAAAAGTWYQATSQGVTPNNRDTYNLMITLHNSQEIYRVSLICNGTIAASTTPAIPIVPAQVILFIEKLQ